MTIINDKIVLSAALCFALSSAGATAESVSLEPETQVLDLETGTATVLVGAVEGAVHKKLGNPVESGTAAGLDE